MRSEQSTGCAANLLPIKNNYRTLAASNDADDEDDDDDDEERECNKCTAQD